MILSGQVRSQRPFAAAFAAVLAIVAGLVVLTGCSAGSAPLAEAADASALTEGGAPEDFAIEAIVRHGRGAAVPSAAHRRPARYVLLANGALHHAAEADPTGPAPPGRGFDASVNLRRNVRAAPPFPPLVRTLTEREIDAIWTLAGDLGLADPTTASPAPNLELLAPDPNEAVSVLAFTGGDRRWAFALPEGDERAQTFMRRLAELAWVTDQPGAPVTVMPRRYDLGPDPYARYRKR